MLVIIHIIQYLHKPHTRFRRKGKKNQIRASHIIYGNSPQENIAPIRSKLFLK